MTEQHLSSYLTKLQDYPDVADRYKQKLHKIGVDPYSLPEHSMSTNPNDFPSVTNMDIVAYLVLTTSFYTKDQMKAFKSLYAYKYFEAGFVSKCSCFKINGFSVVRAKVKHSQRMNSSSVQAWIILNEDGSVDTGHCLCMAGAGEVCSHIGAILYALEYIEAEKSRTSCTDAAGLWKVPTVSKVTYGPIRSINFGRIISGPYIERKSIPPIERDGLVSFLKSIEEAGSSAAVARVIEPFASEIANTRSSVLLNNPFKELFNEEFMELELEQLISLTNDIDIILNDEECFRIEKLTRDQNCSDEWFNQRTGRVTASKFKAVCRTSISKPSISLIKMICYPLKFNFKTVATEWGRSHEDKALKQYQEYASSLHENLHLNKVGLLIRPEFPQFEASPDALVVCDCCGKGCVEVKCPFTLKNMTIDEFARSKSTCLIVTNEHGGLSLDPEHQYFYQIQMQMALSKTSY